MYTLYLGIGDGDVLEFKFNTHIELTSFVASANDYFTQKVFLVTSGGEYGEILITENYFKVLLSLEYDFFDGFDGSKDIDLHIHEYENYTDAYAVALDMREGNKNY